MNMNFGQKPSAETVRSFSTKKVKKGLIELQKKEKLLKSRMKKRKGKPKPNPQPPPIKTSGRHVKA